MPRQVEPVPKPAPGAGPVPGPAWDSDPAPGRAWNSPTAADPDHALDRDDPRVRRGRSPVRMRGHRPRFAAGPREGPDRSACPAIPVDPQGRAAHRTGPLRHRPDDPPRCRQDPGPRPVVGDRPARPRARRDRPYGRLASLPTAAAQPNPLADFDRVVSLRVTSLSGELRLAARTTRTRERDRPRTQPRLRSHRRPRSHRRVSARRQPPGAQQPRGAPGRLHDGPTSGTLGRPGTHWTGSTPPDARAHAAQAAARHSSGGGDPVPPRARHDRLRRRRTGTREIPRRWAALARSSGR